MSLIICFMACILTSGLGISTPKRTPMKLESAVEYFGTQIAIAETLDISEAAVSKWWVFNDGFVPINQALRLNRLSKGELDLRLQDYD